MISGPRWQRLKEIFEQALELPEAERETFLRSVCGQDQELLDELSSLLAAHPDDEFLADTAAEQLVAELEEDPLIGRTLGSWRVVREVGRGGMGTVYEAHHTGEDIEQRVAVKVLGPGVFGPAFLERFVAERRILATLEHENIARLLDGGTTEEGLPYFVLEYVDGLPIDRYCEDHELSVPERIELMLRVCAAVRTAHQKLVVHRDLKPGNILVTEAGVPKLLDFGIAKLLDEEGKAVTTRWTAAGSRPMTPEYASPEQLNGEPITVASDVYSLGVLLYELLTGRLLWQDSKTAPLAERRWAEPPKPSTLVAGRRRLQRRLEGDLDNILLKALSPAPDQRYSAVQDLADDLRRHLEGLPVAARGRSPLYRAQKFVVRHWLALSAVAVVTALAVGLVVLSIRYTSDLEREHNAALAARELSERREVEARELADFAVELFQVSDPGATRGEQVTARELLEAGTERIDTELAGQPLAQARLLEAIGRVYTRLGLYDEAEPRLERSLQIRRERAAEQPLVIASSLQALGFLESERRRFREAVGHFREALELYRTTTAEDSLEIGNVSWQIASQLRYLGELEEADALSRKALGILRRQPEAGDYNLQTAMNVRAGILAARGELEAAEPLYLQLIDARSRTLGEDHPDLAPVYNNLGYLYRRQERYPEAEAAYRRSLALLSPVYGLDHPNSIRLQYNLVSVLFELEKLEEMESILRRLVEIQRAAEPPDHTRLAASLVHGLGKLLVEQARWSEALPLLREGMAVRAMVPESPAATISCDRGMLAVGLFGLGQRQEGRQMAELALTSFGPEEAPAWARQRLQDIARYLETLDEPELAARFLALLESE